MILLSFLMTTSSFGATPQEQLWNFFGKKKMMFRIEAESLLISANCMEYGKKKDCEALKAIPLASLKGLQKYLIGGARPGAVVCERVFKQMVWLGTDRDGNENTFCLFKDGSMISNGSLTHYAIKNDGKG